MAPVTRSQRKAQETAQVLQVPRRFSFRFSEASAPTVYRIDLDLPPRERHKEICRAYEQELIGIQGLYEEVLELVTPSRRALWALKLAARLMLRRVHSDEETEEMRGISEVTNVPIHLIIAYNTFLDLLSGCTSGGVKVTDAGKESEKEKGRTGIVHFRGLDWEMDALRDLIVGVEYVRKGKIVARAITYAGYVGTLTGVRKGLSMSLNYRSSLVSSAPGWKLWLHYLAVLRGYRPSIASRLRQMMLLETAPSLSSLAEGLSEKKWPSCPCYLTFCTESMVMVVEKDLESAVLHQSDEFLAVTNHDRKDETSAEWTNLVANSEYAEKILEDSIDRKRCMEEMYSDGRRPVRAKDVMQWMMTEPVLNESTHLSCMMDPAVDGGGLVWCAVHDGMLVTDSEAE